MFDIITLKINKHQQFFYETFHIDDIGLNTTALSCQNSSTSIEPSSYLELAELIHSMNALEPNV